MYLSAVTGCVLHNEPAVLSRWTQHSKTKAEYSRSKDQDRNNRLRLMAVYSSFRAEERNISLSLVKGY